ncbi:MAG: LON peptidase substrate-binding domain-containing protein [bacterium]|jgi:Lon protease-like protein|nr:LON peptidase substrate-binding domain-containing protein [bacterium]
MKEEIRLENFSGVLPLFPLSNVVLFPHIVLPLHIFEKRYQKLLRDALAGEKYIGMAVLKPGWEKNYQGNPDIYSYACLGKIIQHHPLENGRSNIMLLGVKRVLIGDIISPRPYRTAKVQLLHDKPIEFCPKKIRAYQDKLLELYGEIVIEFAASKRAFPTISTLDMSFSQITDVIAASVGLDVKDQVDLLQNNDVENRADFLIVKMEELLKKGGPSLTFPAKPGDFLRINLN